MKKTLLLLAAIAVSVPSIIASDNTTDKSTGLLLSDFYGRHVSPDGRYIAGDNLEGYAIYDLKTGDYLQPNVDWGIGNCMARRGIAVGIFDGKAAIFRDGEVEIIGPDDSKAHAITPDGSLIVGWIGNEDAVPGGGDITYFPCYWTVDKSGAISELQKLPYPELDFTGRKYQYITAMRVSDDGNVILGQTMDRSGSVCFPIIYTRKDGVWEYSQPANSLINPNNLDLPAFPGDSPVQPDYLNYMTAEEKAAYEEAYQKFVDSGWSSEFYPEPSDYMSGENRDKYLADVAAYKEAADEFNKKMSEFMTAFKAVLKDTPDFVLNQHALSADGTQFMIVCGAKGKEYKGQILFTNYVFNLTDGTYKIIESEKTPAVSELTADGSLLCSTYVGTNSKKPSEAYIFPAGREDYMTLYDWLAETRPEMAEFMNDNLMHAYYYTDPKRGTKIDADPYLFSGIPHSDPAMITIAGGVKSSTWTDVESPASKSTYILSTWQPLDIKGTLKFGADEVSETEGHSVTVRLALDGGEFNQDILNELGLTISDLAVLDISAPRLEQDGTVAIDVEALAEGTATINAVLEDQKVSCAVTVSKEVGIEAVYADGVSVSGGVVIADGQEIEVFNLSGICVAKGYGRYDLNLLPTGLYLIKATGADGKTSLMKVTL